MALDLKKLEKELDDALAKETPESLEAWLLSVRALKKVNVESFNGNNTVPDYISIELLQTSINDILTSSVVYCEPFNTIQVNVEIPIMSPIEDATQILSTFENPEKVDYQLAA